MADGGKRGLLALWFRGLAGDAAPVIIDNDGGYRSFFGRWLARFSGSAEVPPTPDIWTPVTADAGAWAAATADAGTWNAVTQAGGELIWDDLNEDWEDVSDMWSVTWTAATVDAGSWSNVSADSGVWVAV